MRRLKSLCWLVIVAVAVLSPSQVWSAVLYKDYEVHRVFGEDILCDAYVIQKGDHIMELFRLRGQISETAFPEFLKIFKALNPRVQDLNRIYPGQFVLIPLKKVPPGTLPEQSSGSVTLPLVTSKEPEEIPEEPLEPPAEQYEKYTVRYGDTLSGIISSRFGRVGSKNYSAALDRFKELNPNIENVNRIYVGQQLSLPGAGRVTTPVPDAKEAVETLTAEGFKSPLPEKSPKPVEEEALREDPQIGASQPQEGVIEEKDAPVLAVAPVVKEPKPAVSPPPPEKEQSAQITPEEALQPLAGTINALGGMLMNQGSYYFPRPGMPDLELDLAKHPVLRLPDGRFMLLGKQNDLAQEEKKAMKQMWGKVEVFELSKDASPDMLLSRVMGKTGLSPDKVDLSFADGNVEVSVRSHMVLPGQGQYQYVALTWINDPKEACSESLGKYFAENAIKISDILRDPRAIDQAAPEGPGNGGNGDGDGNGTPPALQFSVDSSSPRLFVSAFMKCLALDYKENMPFSFPYAGFQVETVVNRVRTWDGRDILLDFGTMGGQAHHTLKEMDFEIMRLSVIKDMLACAMGLSQELDLDYSWEPVYAAADRSRDSCSSMIIPGILVSSDPTHSVLVTDEPLHAMIVAFLLEKGVSVILVK